LSRSWERHLRRPPPGCNFSILGKPSRDCWTWRLLTLFRATSCSSWLRPDTLYSSWTRYPWAFRLQRIAFVGATPHSLNFSFPFHHLNRQILSLSLNLPVVTSCLRSPSVSRNQVHPRWRLFSPLWSSC
jgi:hypothetical protein